MHKAPEWMSETSPAKRKAARAVDEELREFTHLISDPAASDFGLRFYRLGL
jgi:hypothetical protein